MIIIDTHYLYPFVMGAMRREVETSLGPVAMSRRDFAKHGAATAVPLDEVKELSGEDVITPESAPVDKQVYLKVHMELMEREFQKLSFRERELIGGFLGMFGHEKRTLADLGMQFQLTDEGVLKAKNRALLDFWRRCEAGEAGNWRAVYRAVKGTGEL